MARLLVSCPNPNCRHTGFAAVMLPALLTCSRCHQANTIRQAEAQIAGDGDNSGSAGNEARKQRREQDSRRRARI
jgi:hypothetical protein